MRTKMIAAAALSTLLLGSAALAQNTPNSGTGTPGMLGNKSGPAVKSDQNATPPDTSGVKGLTNPGPPCSRPKSDVAR